MQTHMTLLYVTYRLIFVLKFLFFIYRLKHIFVEPGSFVQLDFVILRNYLKMLMFSRFSAWFWVDMLGAGFRIVKWDYFCFVFCSLFAMVFCFPWSFLFFLYSYAFCSDMKLSCGR